MRWAGMATLLLLLAGCQKSFDERYAEAQKKLSDQAAAIDKELAAKASEAAAGEAIATPAADASGVAAK